MWVAWPGHDTGVNGHGGNLAVARGGWGPWGSHDYSPSTDRLLCLVLSQDWHILLGGDPCKHNVWEGLGPQNHSRSEASPHSRDSGSGSRRMLRLQLISAVCKSSQGNSQHEKSKTYLEIKVIRNMVFKYNSQLTHAEPSNKGEKRQYSGSLSLTTLLIRILRGLVKDWRVSCKL